LHQAPREIRILKHLYTFQGIFLLAIVAYLLVGLRIINYFFPPPPEAYHVTGAGAFMGVFFAVLVVGVFVLALLFFGIARGIIRGKYRDLGLVVSGLGLLILPQGLLQAVSFMLSLQYPADHVFSGADWIHLTSVICFLTFGVASVACVYYATRPATKTFLLHRADRQDEQ